MNPFHRIAHEIFGDCKATPAPEPVPLMTPEEREKLPEEDRLVLALLDASSASGRWKQEGE
jgi:hypothetical protein